ncbi:MAG: ribosome maturation factor RimP [Desulfobulbus sp.]|jgi:ribosome maturation factor RimP
MQAEREEARRGPGSAERTLAILQDFVDPLLTDLGMELVELQFRREGQGWVLRLFIDKEGGVTIDDCATVSREVGAYLDVEDLIEHAYHLEVSSPGLERPLKKAGDYERFAGRLARFKLREPLAGTKVVIGVLRGLDGGAVLVEVDGQVVRIEREMISRARLTL